MTTYIPSLTLPSAIFASPVVSILLPVAIGSSIGYLVSPKNTQNTYMALKQPPLRPPPYVFGPVWTVLYGLMGYSAHRAWSIGMSSLNPQTIALTKQGATLYTISLALNFIWTPLFFVLGRPVLATADIVTLTAVVGYLISTWGKVDKVAAWTLAPYMGWLGFATYLCAATGYLNNWDTSSKQRPMPSTKKGDNEHFVNETGDKKQL